MKEFIQERKHGPELPESRFEKFIDDLKEQYQNQKEILEKAGILEKLSNGELGIKGVDGKGYPFPEREEVLKRMREKKEIVQTKSEQGFKKLLIVPFGMKLNDLIRKYEEIILKHYREGKLFATKENDDEPDAPLELAERGPVEMRDRYHRADEGDKIVYGSKKFSTYSEGKTKKEILVQTNQGFKICLIEDLPIIPQEGKGRTIGGRKQIEAGKSPEEYLNMLQTDDDLAHEQGMTPEDQIAYAIYYLENKNQVIDDVRKTGKGAASYQIGAFFPFRSVPLAYWGGWRDDNGREQTRAVLGRCIPEIKYPDRGVRTLVEI